MDTINQPVQSKAGKLSFIIIIIVIIIIITVVLVDFYLQDVITLLPVIITSLPSFKRQLKTFLFTKSFPSV